MTKSRFEVVPGGRGGEDDFFAPFVIVDGIHCYGPREIDEAYGVYVRMLKRARQPVPDLSAEIAAAKLALAQARTQWLNAA